MTCSQEPISKFLIITSSAGGGLLQAAIAQEQCILAEMPHAQIIKCDVLKDWVWKWLGKFCIESWNSAQKKGDVRSQILLTNCHWMFDYLTWPSVFFHTLSILRKGNIDRVIDTQTTSTGAIMKAIRLYNRINKKNVVLEKVVVDLPTRKASHFFRPIKALSKKDKKYLKVRTIAPLLEEGQTAEEFWQHYCGLSETDIHYEDVNVRQAFRSLQGKPRTENSLSIALQFKSKEELYWMEKSFQKGEIQTEVQDNHIRFDIPKEARVITILLGSQPAGLATINYTKQFIQIARELPPGSLPIYLFVFCADHESHKVSLLQAVSQEVQSQENYPSLLSVIPFSFQSEDAIASLFHRSNATCSRSGGGTAMELMAVSTGEIWVHSETKKKQKDPSLKDLLKGIPAWESESALYLLKLRGAKIVTPDILTPHAYRLLTPNIIQS